MYYFSPLLIFYQRKIFLHGEFEDFRFRKKRITLESSVILLTYLKNSFHRFIFLPDHRENFTIIVPNFPTSPILGEREKIYPPDDPLPIFITGTKPSARNPSPSVKPVETNPQSEKQANQTPFPLPQRFPIKLRRFTDHLSHASVTR